MSVPQAFKGQVPDLLGSQTIDQLTNPIFNRDFEPALLNLQWITPIGAPCTIGYFWRGAQIICLFKIVVPWSISHIQRERRLYQEGLTKTYTIKLPNPPHDYDLCWPTLRAWRFMTKLYILKLKRKCALCALVNNEVFFVLCGKFKLEWCQILDRAFFFTLVSFVI